MSAMRYLHIGINWIGPPRTDDVKRLIDDSSVTADWFSYSNNCWIIYTPFTAVQWSIYLHHVIGGEDQLIILEVTNLPAIGGWLPQWAWDWFSKDRSNTRLIADTNQVGRLISG